jgi:glycosyltransferase involved in cell wall biosynthesis
MISWEYPPYVVGGLGRHVAELTPALVQEGVDLHVVTPTANKEEAGIRVEDGATIHRVFAAIIGADVPDIYARVTVANKILIDYAQNLPKIYGPFELIHVHDWLTGFAGMTLKESWECPLVATIHATEQGRTRGHLNNPLQYAIDSAERELMHMASQVIVCSRYMVRELHELFHVPAEKVTVIPNAVIVDSIHNGHSPAELATLWAKFADPDDLLVFTISRLVYEKGVHQLVQAAPRILAECPTARILIAGRGPEAENLKQQATYLGVADRVNFIGFITDEERTILLSNAACAIFPSLYEPFGIVALEAMALNCPVVVSDVGGFSEMVKHLETGVTVYPDDPNSVAWGILHTLKHPGLARGYAANARRSIDLLFNWPRVARLTLALYRRIVGQQVKLEMPPQILEG